LSAIFFGGRGVSEGRGVLTISLIIPIHKSKFILNGKVEKIISYIVIPLLLCSALTCGSKNVPKDNSTQQTNQNTKQDTKQNVSKEPSGYKPECDSALWKHVWKSERLEVFDWCKTVTGVIEEIKEDGDGDTHMHLRLDAGQENLVNDKNAEKKNGCLIIEAICVNKISKKKAVQPCEGLINNVLIPSVGSHVSVKGSYVKDSHNGWMEIHPITKLEIIN